MLIPSVPIDRFGPFGGATEIRLFGAGYVTSKPLVSVTTIWYRIFRPPNGNGIGF